MKNMTDLQEAASILRGFISLYNITGENLHEQTASIQKEYAELVNNLIEKIDAE